LVAEKDPGGWNIERPFRASSARVYPCLDGFAVTFAVTWGWRPSELHAIARFMTRLAKQGRGKR
jgi:hypothetical protein